MKTPRQNPDKIRTEQGQNNDAEKPPGFQPDVFLKNGETSNNNQIRSEACADWVECPQDAYKRSNVYRKRLAYAPYRLIKTANI